MPTILQCRACGIKRQARSDLVGRAPATIRNCHAVLRRALTIAVREGHITTNPATLMDGPGAGQSSEAAAVDFVPLTPTEIAAILDAAAKLERNAVRWPFALATGTRQGEAIGLTWDRVNLTDGVATIDRQLRRYRARHTCGPKRPDGTWPCGEKQPIRCPDLTRHGCGTPTRRGTWPCGRTHSSRCPQRVGSVGLVLAPPKTDAGTRTIALPGSIVDELRAHRATQRHDRTPPAWSRSAPPR